MVIKLGIGKSGTREPNRATRASQMSNSVSVSAEDVAFASIKLQEEEEEVEETVGGNQEVKCVLPLSITS